MGFLKRWFSGGKAAVQQAHRRDNQLLQTLLLMEQKRMETQAILQEKRGELELRKLQLEIENSENLEKVRAQRAEADEDLRQRRREYAIKARQAMAAKRQQAQNAPPAQTECVVCRNPSDPAMTVNDVAFHNAGHRMGGTLFGN